MPGTTARRTRGGRRESAHVPAGPLRPRAAAGTVRTAVQRGRPPGFETRPLRGAGAALRRGFHPASSALAAPARRALIAGRRQRLPPVARCDVERDGEQVGPTRQDPDVPHRPSRPYPCSGARVRNPSGPGSRTSPDERPYICVQPTPPLGTVSHRCKRGADHICGRPLDLNATARARGRPLDPKAPARACGRRVGRRRLRSRGRDATRASPTVAGPSLALDLRVHAGRHAEH